MHYPMNKIIEVSNELLQTGKTGASMSEVIAAAFVLDRMEYLPQGYSTIEAWERLGDWQRYVRRIRHQYMHLINYKQGA